MNATPPFQSFPEIEPVAAAESATEAASAVRSVDRAAAILLALGRWDGEAGVSEIARSLGLHKSTASRLLSTLQKRGLVEQDPDSNKYRLGLAIVRLGGHAERTLDLQSIAMIEVEGVARFLKETTAFGVLQGDNAVTLAWVDGSGLGSGHPGRRLPLHATALGKVLLASRPERDVIRLSRLGFTRFTPDTIVRVDLLLEEFGRVRQRGYATAFGEYEAAVNAVAVPVFDRRSTVVGAVEVRASGNRITPSRVPELIEGIRVAASAITGRIGGVVGPN